MTATSTRLLGVCQTCSGEFPLTKDLKIPVHPWPDGSPRCHGSRRVPDRLEWARPAEVHVPAPPDLVPPARGPVPKGVCGAGPGPCGNTPARLFMFGWRCRVCAPKAGAA